MGVIIAYILIGLVAWFLAFYHDYREVANERWCENPTEFANQFVVFHMLAAIFWPLVLCILVFVGIAMGIGWVFEKTIGQGFGKLAAWLTKRGW